MSDTSDKVLQHHSDMITELGGLFATNSKEWRSICAELEMLGHITTHQMGDVKSMHDVCKYLMKRDKIYYGRYNILRGVLGKQNVAATRIIDKYTELIRQENTCNGIENIDESQAGFSQQKSADRKRKSGPSGDRELENESKLEKGKRLKVEEDTSYQFRKLIKDTHAARIIGVWNNARNAVGRIKGPLITGTGIRVGTKYILTAYHVAKDIAKSSESDDTDWSKLNSKQVWIEFPFPKEAKFHFVGEEPVSNESLDFAILELKTAATEFPKPIRKFGKPDSKQPFALLGHPAKPDNKIMQFDSHIKLFDLDADVKAAGDAARYSALPGEKKRKYRHEYMLNEHGDERPGYEGIRDKGKVLFDCWVQHGASGAPGIVMGNDDEEPICTLMLVRGFPVQAFEKEKKEEFPHEEMIEQGVAMEEIAKQTNRKGNKGKLIKKDIFGENFPQL